MTAAFVNSIVSLISISGLYSKAMYTSIFKTNHDGCMRKFYIIGSVTAQCVGSENKE
jgi:hypothetical protein